MAVDNNFPDALSGQYPAGQLFTGIVLTGPDTVPQSTLQSMQQNGVQTVFIIGGSAAIHPSVISQLQNTEAFVCGGTGPRLNGSGQPIMLNVKVLAGATRYDTNLAANTFFPAGNVGIMNMTTNGFNPMWATAFLATGTNFPDALSAGALATEAVCADGDFPPCDEAGQAHTEGFPVILTDPNGLSVQASNEIADLGIQQVIVAGGPAAVSQGVVTSVQGLSLMKRVVQAYGADRTGTAACLAALNLAQANATTVAPLSNAKGSFGSSCVDPGGSTSPIGLVWGSDNAPPNGDNWGIFPVGPAVGLARGDLYPDALTAGPFLGGFNDAPLMLTEDPNTLGSATTTFLQQIGVPPAGYTPISGLVVFGGPAAVSDATVNAAQGALST
jgi:hypothetical protein